MPDFQILKNLKAILVRYSAAPAPPPKADAV
jgi:hypothetical protein